MHDRLVCSKSERECVSSSHKNLMGYVVLGDCSGVGGGVGRAWGVVVVEVVVVEVGGRGKNAVGGGLQASRCGCPPRSHASSSLISLYMPAVEVLRESLAPLQLSRLPRRDRDDGGVSQPKAEHWHGHGATVPSGRPSSPTSVQRTGLSASRLTKGGHVLQVACAGHWYNRVGDKARDGGRAFR
jgi:hypothetical protein